MILINIPDDYHEEIEAGIKASKEGKDLEDNPYPEFTYSRHVWIMGFLASENGWDVEY